jgi:hypothetical protein
MIIDLEKIEKIISEPSSFNNKELMECMDILANEHEKVKESIIQMTYQVDKLENSYNKILEEYKKRK